MGDTRSTLERAINHEEDRRKQAEEDVPVRRDVRFPVDLDEELKRQATRLAWPVNRLIVSVLREVMFDGG